MTSWADEWPAGTADALVEDVRSLGAKVTPRTVTDYVEVGLLSPPLYRKTTQRGSDRRIYPPEQRRLFYELTAAKLRSPIKRVPHRTMIPIILFMWCMDDTVIPDIQARRALRAWAQNAGINSHPHRRDTAKKVIKQFAHPLATTGQRRIAQQWLLEGESSRKPNFDAIAEALSNIASPWRSRGVPEIIRGIGPADAPVTTDQVVAMWEFTLQVTQSLALETVPEHVLRRALQEHRQYWQEYQNIRPKWEAQAGDMADIFELPTNQEQAARQRVNGFITVLGNTLDLARPAFTRAEKRARARLR
ncbi:hypothetical protein IAG44_20230 [Streptomyces roseirectus]|uniref:Uncharacterized protein n=1 Tax=Streptomyces roseirectus TaxID=2768066 RepID=A0A7H0IFF9_9ACTN|nr:hypothetical protein [Streptomyces roseirectus]QNP71525.1 hypothetical protein IAG44_20230 [Streptomyces roseirectus]